MAILPSFSSKMFKLHTDLHLHSIASGHAFNTIDEIINFALSREYEVIGISDHGPKMERAPHEGYYEMLYRLPKVFGNMKVLYGCEANILDLEGNLDISQSLCRNLDYVIAGLHKRTPYFGKSIEENTQAIVAAVSSGFVDIVSHPVSLNFTTDVKKIVQAARQHDVILEINKTVLTEAIRKNCPDVICATKLLISEACLFNVPLLFGSDAHHISEMGISADERELFERKYNLKVDFLINQDAGFVLNFLQKRRNNYRKVYFDDE